MESSKPKALCRMKPLLLRFEEPDTEAQFLKHYASYVESLFVALTFAMYLMLIVLSNDNAWRAVHLAQFIVLFSSAWMSRSARLFLVALDFVFFILSGGLDQLMTYGCFFVANFMHSFWCVASQVTVEQAYMLVLVAMVSHPMVSFLGYVYWKEMAVLNFIGFSFGWMHERLARTAFQQSLMSSIHTIAELAERTESEIAHFQDNFLSKIGALTTDLRIHALLRRAKMWVNAHSAITRLRSGSYVSKPSVVHMPTILFEMSFDVVEAVGYVEVDELLFMLCCEQARSNGIRYAVGRVQIHQTLVGGTLITSFVSKDAETTVPVPPDHDFFAYGKTTRGTGIGLATVKLACDTLGGECSLQAVGAGYTKLTVSVPARLADAPVSTRPPPPLPLTIVVVTHDPTMRTISASFSALAPSVVVDEVGLRMEDRKDARHLCELVLKAKPQLVICAINADGISCIAVANELHEQGFNGVVVVLTSHAGEEETKALRDCEGFVDAIVANDQDAAQATLDVYSRLAHLGEVPAGFCYCIEFDLSRIIHLVSANLAVEVSAKAQLIAERCAYFSSASRMRKMAALVVREPTEKNVQRLARMCRQMRFFVEIERRPVS